MFNNIYSFIITSLNRSDERSTNVIKNIVASFAVKGVSIAASLLLVPLMIEYVNPVQCGIWLTLSSIIAWFAFFDIGFGNGLRNKFTEAKAIGDYSKAQAYVSTTYICLTIVFTIVWILFFIINFFIDWSLILNVPEQPAKELSVVAIITFSFFCIQVILKTINTLLIADQKPAKSAFLDMLGQILTLVLIFILTKMTSGSLSCLALALGIPPILIMVFSSFWLFNRNYKKYKPSIRLFEIKTAKEILSLGGKFFFIQIAAIILYQTTNIIIAQVSNPENVTVYNTAYRYFNVIAMISGIILTPFWSAFTESYTLKDFRWMKRMYKNLSRIILLLCVFVVIQLAVSPVIYGLWIGERIHIPFEISFVIALFMISFIWSSLYAQILNGLGKIKLQLTFSAICVCINIPLAWFLGKKMGVPGVIIPSVILNFITAILYSIQVRFILVGKTKGIWNK